MSGSKIITFFHCRQCVEQLPHGESPGSWSHLSVGIMANGNLKVWCVRHGMDVAEFAPPGSVQRVTMSVYRRADAGLDIVMVHTGINCGDAKMPRDAEVHVTGQSAEFHYPALETDQQRQAQTGLSSKGKYRVGIDFNPSNNPTVAEVKGKAADLIDFIDGIPDHGNGEIARLKALAQTEIKSAAMWAVKAATKQVER